MSAVVTPDPRRNAEGYLDLTAYEAIKRAQRTNFGYRPLVYICSPYSGDTTANVRLAREFCKVAIARRKIPLAPHLLFPQFMNDNHPAQRVVGDVLQPDPALALRSDVGVRRPGL